MNDKPDLAKRVLDSACKRLLAKGNFGAEQRARALWRSLTTDQQRVHLACIMDDLATERR